MAASAGLKLVRDNPSPDRFPRSDRTITSGELAPAECLALEPALQLDIDEFAGGIFAASEQIGDCAAFCAGLTFRLRRQRNVEWLLGADVIGPVRSGGRRHSPAAVHD